MVNYDFDGYVKDHTRSALLITRAYRDTNSLSFFGGRPIMPEGMEWPKCDVNGELHPMPFLGQINLAELKGTNSLPREMPEEGVLYFFYNEALQSIGDRKAQCVFFSNVLTNMRPVEQPEPQSLIGNLDIENDCFCSDTSTYIHFPRALFPKDEILFAKFKDIQSPMIGSNIDHSKTNSMMHEFDMFETTEVSNAFQLINGISLVERRANRPQMQFARILDSEQEASDVLTRIFGASYEPPTPLFQEWPQTWLHIGLYLSQSSVFKRDGRKFRKLPNISLKYDFLSESENWIRLAKLHGPFTHVPRATKQEFLNWASENFITNYRAWKQDKSKMVEYAIAISLAGVKGSAQNATNLCLDLEQAHQELISEEEKKDYIHLSSSEPYTSMPWSRHQMFGFGHNCQNAARDNLDKVLLLQLVADGGMLWSFADLGVLQFWISKDDLKNRCFENAFVTLEGS